MRGQHCLHGNRKSHKALTSVSQTLPGPGEERPGSLATLEGGLAVSSPVRPSGSAR